MNRKKLVLFLILITFWLTTKAQEKVLADLSRPEQQVVIEKNRMYVIEGATIFIYSLKDFKLIKQFGKRGEGPKEFMTNSMMGPMGALAIDARNDVLLVKSMNKLSWFTQDGDFIKEKKAQDGLMLLAFLFGKHVVVQKYDLGNIRQIALVVLNENLEHVKELARIDDSFQMGKGLTVLKANPVQRVYEDKLFMAWKNEIEIKVLDAELKDMFTIRHPLKREPVTENDKKRIIHFLKTSPQTKNIFEILKPIGFPEYYPAIRGMFITGGKIYVVTFTAETVDESQDTDILIFDVSGKYIKKIVVKLSMMDPLMTSPFVIHERKLYQLVENVEEEEWSVHISKLD